MAEPSGEVRADADSLSLVPGPAADGPASEQRPMSKNALKKAAKAERLAALKLERRAREKAAKKEKKRERAEKRAAGELDEEEEEEKKRHAKKPRLQFGGTVVIDLGFDDMMNEKEIKSLCSQLAYTHSANRQAAFPFSLIFTSLNGRTHERLESLGEASYKRWANTQWWSEGYERLWNGQDGLPDSSRPTNAAKSETGFSGLVNLEEKGKVLADSGPSSAEETTNSPSNPLFVPQDRVVYLTADTEDELVELKPDEVYIIGGICDHNRYKNLCLDKAKESGVRTARLPIGRYLASLPTRKVLTVNQVFEILVKWVETKDWEESLYSVIPKRKFQQGGKGNQDANIDAAVEDDADAEEAARQAEQGTSSRTQSVIE